MLRLEAQGGREILHDEHIVQQVLHERLHLRLRLHLVQRPGDAAVRQELALAHRRGAKQVPRNERRAAQPSLGQLADDLLAQGGVAEQHRLQVIAQRRFDRGDELRLHFDQRSDEAVDAAFDAIRIIETLEHVLRALLEALALLHDLVQHLEARAALRELALQRVQFLRGGIALAAQLRDGVACCP